MIGSLLALIMSLSGKGDKMIEVGLPMLVTFLGVLLLLARSESPK